MLLQTTLALAGFGLTNAAFLNRRQASSTSSASSSTPQYFQTAPELFAGPTPTGVAPFLAETNPAPFPSVSYIPPQPLETQVPISGNVNNSNIYQLFGQLSHYFPNPIGLGVNEYPLPAGANITALYMLHRHGSRYPTTGSGAPTTGQKIVNATGTFNATGALSFLNTWTYKLGAEILVPVGKQEMFDSGVLHYYNYAHLYPNNGSKIIARSTTQDRMTQSAEYFLAGFFGLGWTQNATLELILEQNGFNNSLAGYYDCPNNNNNASLQYGNFAESQWYNIYLANATKRINSMISGRLNFTVSDVYNMQSLCAYETVALGYSSFCDLFTYDEWQGYEYSVDINFAGNNAFQNPAGRGTGIGWVLETVARMQHQLIPHPEGPLNYTLDSMPSTFPTNQALNFDFSHDTNIMSILTAFGLTQFAPFLPATQMVPHDLVVSHLEPFGARLDIEVITAPHPVSPSRNGTAAYDYTPGYATQYVHFILNQRTVPLGKSYPQCGNRTDGWCEMGTFLQVMSTKYNESEYQFACFGSYPNVTYGGVTNGVPQVPPPS